MNTQNHNTHDAAAPAELARIALALDRLGAAERGAADRSMESRLLAGVPRDLREAEEAPALRFTTAPGSGAASAFRFRYAAGVALGALTIAASWLATSGPAQTPTAVATTDVSDRIAAELEAFLIAGGSWDFGIADEISSLRSDLDAVSMGIDLFSLEALDLGEDML